MSATVTNAAVADTAAQDTRKMLTAGIIRQRRMTALVERIPGRVTMVTRVLERKRVA